MFCHVTDKFLEDEGVVLEKLAGKEIKTRCAADFGHYGIIVRGDLSLILGIDGGAQQQRATFFAGPASCGVSYGGQCFVDFFHRDRALRHIENL